MIDNNLDFDIALYPYELVTYGETGQVCQNWLQYRLIKKYLENMTQDQTLVMASRDILLDFLDLTLCSKSNNYNGFLWLVSWMTTITGLEELQWV